MKKKLSHSGKVVLLFAGAVFLSGVVCGFVYWGMLKDSENCIIDHDSTTTAAPGTDTDCPPDALMLATPLLVLAGFCIACIVGYRKDDSRLFTDQIVNRNEQVLTTDGALDPLPLRV